MRARPAPNAARTLIWSDASGARWEAFDAFRRLALVLPITHYLVVAAVLKTHGEMRVALVVGLLVLFSPPTAWLVAVARRRRGDSTQPGKDQGNRLR